jgi:hypothetical protein
MSCTEITPQLEQLTPAKLFKVMAWLKHRFHARTEANRPALAHLNADRDEGRKVGVEEFKHRAGLA